ncbi:MAG: hypothetical protein EOO51_09255 [Flavobacterium sp.]|nr:MAG: hypothetical protein EOO51_09255 [Flavobacterium sp.]
MKNVYLYKSSLVIKIALGTAILLIIYITSVFFNQMQSLSGSVRSMSNSNRKLVELERILSIVSVNENSIRSFIITGDSIYLQKRFYKERILEPEFQRLAALQAESGSKTFNVDTLRKMVSVRFSYYGKLLKAAERTDAEGKENLGLMLATSDELTDRVRDYVYSTMDTEATNVSIYEINHKYEIETSIITSFLLVTIALFILLISLSRINDDLKNLKRLNDELKFLNYTFNTAESIAGISHWKYNLKTQKYTFSENFFRIAGLDPDAFEPNMESILPHLHPDDRAMVVDAYSDSLQNKTPTSLIYRLYTSKGEMRYIRSVSSFGENSQGEIVKIGVNYDITEQYKNTVNLEEKNKRLIAINAELESFNDIVSHDLQEPLRKIQMFISRLHDDELDKLSETGREYFSRIATAANRMQNLLIDLVNYSRAVKGNKALENTDLNAIVENVISELTLNITEKGAIVQTEALPTIYAIPFQLHQLFINLITNSLKFTREGVTPEIKITSEPIDSTEIYKEQEFSARQFCKIIFSDNGIGFRQEFADKIFLLFRRLEKDSYQGTGIGLAICKKIIENHNGFIFAEGVPGEGAKFIIYLPKA